MSGRRSPLRRRTITRRQDVAKSLPEARESWPLPAIADILAEKVESPTSLETLATCHLKWLLSHVADLGAGRIRSIPDANRLFGNIAHAIAQEVFVPGPVPSGPQARKHAEQIFDRVVQQIAAPLLKPGGAGDLAFARERIPRALGTLAELLSTDGWEIIGTEMEVTHDFGNGLKVKGYTDLRVRHPVHETGVIDLKWSRRDKRRRDEVKKGRAVQISTYGHAVEPGQQAALDFRRPLMGCRVSTHADGARGTTACRVLFRDSSRSQSREEPLAKLRVSLRVLAVGESDRLLWVLGKQPLPDHSRLLQPAKLYQSHYETPQGCSIRRLFLEGLLNPRQCFVGATTNQ